MLSKYLLIGSIATFIFYLSSNMATQILPESLSTFIGNAISFMFGYFAQMRYVFNVTSNHKAMIPKYLFLLIVIFSYGQIITFSASVISIPYLLTSAFIAISTPIFSYPLQKYWVFKISDGGGGKKLTISASILTFTISKLTLKYLIFFPHIYSLLYLRMQRILIW